MLFAFVFPVQAGGNNFPSVTQFALFSNTDFPYPESIARDKDGNLYLSLTFSSVINKVSNADTSIAPVVTEFATIPDIYLLGVEIGPDDNLYVVGAIGGIWRVNTITGFVQKYADLPGLGTINDLVFDKAGNLYIGDDTLNLIWRVTPNGQTSVWSQDPLFQVVNHQNFPFDEGVNGLEFSGNTIYVTNTSEGYIIAIDINQDGTAKPGRIVASDPRLIGADGIISTPNGVLYTVNNLQNALLRVTPDGEVSTVVAGNVLRFPTGLVFGQNRREIFIANNGDAFFGTNPFNQGVVRVKLW